MSLKSAIYSGELSTIYQSQAELYNKNMSMTVFYENKNYDPDQIEDHHLGRATLKTLKQYADKINQIEIVSDHQETHGSVRLRTIRMAQALLKKNIGIGDVISTCGQNHSDIIIPIVAAFYIGAVAYPLAENTSNAEMDHLLTLGKPKIIFCDSNQASTIRSSAKNLGIKVEIVIFGTNEFSEFLKVTNTEEKFKAVEFDPETTVALLTCSSGTTGKPKAISLHHKMLSIAIVITALHQDKNKISQYSNINFSTMSWLSGMMTLLPSCLHGQTRIHSATGYNPELFLSAVKKYKPTCALLNEYVCATMLKSPRLAETDLGCIKIILILGTLVSESLRNGVKKAAYNAEVKNSYATTESSGILVDFPHNVYRTNSCGKALPWVQCKIIDIETGKDLGINQNGELCGRGKTFFTGYYNDSVTTSKAFTEDGWYKTGDLAYIDEDGFIYIVDRIKEVLKYRSYHVMPSELEACIKQLEGVIKVCVVGKPDPVNGQLPMAFIQKLPGSNINADDVQKLIKETFSDAKQLRGGVIFLNDFPITPSGKNNRYAIKMLAKNM